MFNKDRSWLVANRKLGPDHLGNVSRIRSGTVSLAPPTIIPAQEAAWSNPFTILGARPGDKLTLEPPGDLEVTVTYSGCRITGRDTAEARFTNHTGVANPTTIERDWSYTLSRGRGA